MADKYEILKNVFGYEKFRPAQEDIIDSILSGRDVLAVMPTGAGKSLCFQVPALMMEGVTVVISPLISLMSDQVSALVQAGVKAAYLNSSLTLSQQNRVISNFRAGMYKLIYVAPERLETEGFIGAAADMEISMVAVDEAHCISRWGQDFRPSYGNITGFISALPCRPVVSAFTATATEQVKQDVASKLTLSDPYIVTTGFDRPNLYFGVIRERKRERILLEMIKERSGKSGIVYCSTRKNTEKITILLKENGISAAPYHAGLSDEVRKRNQEDFIYDRIRVIVATNAFGMGIDKSNVSFVFHYNMPKDMESYYQEAGRAGRDGENAECILFFSGSDYVTNKMLIEDSRESFDDDISRRQKIALDMKKLSLMMDYCEGTSCLRSFILNYFGESTGDFCGNCSYCLDTSEKTDITIEAQKILSCIVRMKKPYGITLLTEVLRGSTAEKVKSFGFDNLSTYGIMKDCSEEKLRYLIFSLIRGGYIRREGEDYPVLKITAEAVPVLRGEKKVEIKLPIDKKERKKAAAKETVKEEYSVSSELMSRLKALRLKLASEEKIPAYIVFSDATLRNMCTALPTTLDEMHGVSGVGEKKLEKYGEAFLAEIKAFTDENGFGEKHIPTKDDDPLVSIANKAPSVALSGETMPLTAFCDTLIAGTDVVSGNKPLRDAIFGWLTDKGYLECTKDEKGHLKRIITQKSAEAGIITTLKTASDGRTYQQVMFTSEAQRFIIENLPAMIDEYDRKKETSPDLSS